MGDALARPKDDPAYVQAMADAFLNADLNARLIRNRAATFLPPAPDDAIDGVFIGDLLIVNVGGSPPGSDQVEDFTQVKGNGSGVVAFEKGTGKVRYKFSD